MKKIFLILGLFCIFVSFAAVPKLEKIKDRMYVPETISKNLKNEIKNDTKNLTEYEIIIYCKNKTRSLLTFSTKCEKFDDSKITKMHCVGYAKVYSTICNYAFKVNNIKSSAKPVVGYVTWNKINLHKLSKLFPTKIGNFIKDHDFVEITYSEGTLYLDPCLNIINF